MNKGNTNSKYPYETNEEWIRRYIAKPLKPFGSEKKLNRAARNRYKKTTK